MNETAGMLEARLMLIERIRKVEHALAHAEQARVAAALMRGRSHDLGNAIQIVKLSALELTRRLAELGNPDIEDLLSDMNVAADQSTRLLAEMIDATRPTERIQLGAVVTHPVRAAIELARTAWRSTIPSTRSALPRSSMPWCSPLRSTPGTPRALHSCSANG
jgi:K+-sensing histidine kinase KdpD